MISVTQCAALAGLAPNEMFLGVTPSAKHYSLLSSYLLNLKRGPVVVRTIIVADLRSFLDLGASRRAADLLIVLRLFLSEYSEAGYILPRRERRNDLSSDIPQIAVNPVPNLPRARGFWQAGSTAEACEWASGRPDAVPSAKKYRVCPHRDTPPFRSLRMSRRAATQSR